MAKRTTKEKQIQFNQCRNDVAHGMRYGAADWLRSHGFGGRQPPLMESFRLAERYCKKVMKSSRAKR